MRVNWLIVAVVLLNIGLSSALFDWLKPKKETAAKCGKFAHHSKDDLRKAALLADAVYNPDPWAAATAASGLKNVFHLSMGPFDLDYGLAEPAGGLGPRKTAWVVFAGSKTLGDWMMNFDIRLLSLPEWVTVGEEFRPAIPEGNEEGALEAPGLGAVHRGFFTQMNSARAKIEDLLTRHEAAGGTRVIVSGHSLGGAMSVLCATLMQSRFPNLEIELITFGAPTPAMPKFGGLVTERLDGRVTMVAHDGDPVPCIPPGFFFDLPGGLVWNKESQYWTNERDRDHSCLGNLLNMGIGNHLMGSYRSILADNC